MKSLPNHFGFWGGGIEGEETPEQGLMREIKEEFGINLDLQKTKHFNHYEFLRSAKDICLLEVENGWENKIVIGEGDYGRWFKVSEALERLDIIFEDKGCFK